MATLTIRNVPPDVVSALKLLSKHHHKSTEQEIRDLLVAHVGTRNSVVEQIEASWHNQRRPTTAREIEAWIETGRSRPA